MGSGLEGGSGFQVLQFQGVFGIRVLGCRVKVSGVQDAGFGVSDSTPLIQSYTRTHRGFQGLEGLGFRGELHGLEYMEFMIERFGFRGSRV